MLNEVWQTLEQKLSVHLNVRFRIAQCDRISGGDINESFLISDGSKNFFVKINQKHFYKLFEQEAYALSQIYQTGQIKCPKVILFSQSAQYSFLVLEFISLTNASAMQWRLMGKALAQLHKNTSHGQFGWQYDNYIGSTVQPNIWQSNWREFFAEQRIGWQLQLLKEKAICFGDINHIITRCHDALLNHKVSPCLVHGDLWRGNLGFANNQPIIYDPACYYGDREVDIAMTELFGPLPINFYQSYNDVYPLPVGYEKRKQVYNFYHILNHANIFAGNYIEQAQAMLSRILASH